MRRRFPTKCSTAILAALAALGSLPAAAAGVRGQTGHYRVELTTDPAVIPVAKARMILKITDADGKPVTGAQVRTLVKMPTMEMGEREQIARPRPGEPGVYEAPAVFAMAGGYTARIQIGGAHGAATVTIPLETGQDTAVSTGGGFSARTLLLGLIGLLALAFVLYRVRRTGQRPNWRVVFNRSVVAGVLLLAAMLVASSYAVRHFRRPGAMTPIEAQSMEMSTPAPPGTAPVVLATVERGAVESTVRYTGSAVGYVEQQVTPRVTGWIVWMPFYAGDRVRQGQLLARLDTSQAAPQVAERQAAVGMAEQEVAVARTEYQQALAGVKEAHAEVGMRKGALEEARANLTAAREERAGAEADLAAAETQVADAAAALASAQASQEYWRAEVRRMRELLTAGAVSGEEYQREKAQAEDAEAKVRQAQARVTQVQAGVRAAQARLRKADAMIAAAGTKLEQMSSELEAHYAHVHTAQAGVTTAQRRIEAARAGVRQARAALAGAATTRGYSEIRSLVDGVVTRRVVSPGVLVSPGQVILEVARISPIRLQANVAEADLEAVRVGAPVTVRGQDTTSPPVRARVTSMTPSVDPVARTAVVEAVVPNADRRFLPGQFVAMAISTGRSGGALRIPSRAVRWRTPASGGVLSTRSTPFAWVAEPGASHGEYTVRAVDLRVGRGDGTYTEILAGLTEDQRVVAAGQDDLKNGDTVANISARLPAHDRPPTADHSPAPHAQHPRPTTQESTPKAQHPTPNAQRPVQYTCPMHPEVVSDRPGKCPKCQMDLVKKEGAR